MFWRWRWNSKKLQSEPEFNIKAPTAFGMKEIIITTVRNRVWKYRTEQLNINNLDTIAEEIWREYEKLYFDTTNGREAVDTLVKICENYEHKMREGTFTSIKEYGK